MCSCLCMYWSTQTHMPIDSRIRSQWDDKNSCRSVSMPYTRFGPHTSTRQANYDGKHTHTTVHRTLIENALAYTHTRRRIHSVLCCCFYYSHSETVWSKPLLTLHRVLVCSKRKYYVLYSFHFSQFFFFFITIAVVVAVAVVVVAVVVFFFLVTNSPNFVCVFSSSPSYCSWFGHLNANENRIFVKIRKIINSICGFSVSSTIANGKYGLDRCTNGMKCATRQMN